MSSSEKEAGKSCCCSDVTRRDFLKTGAVAGAVAGGSVGAFYFGYGSVQASPVRVGVIGTGDEGSVLIGALNPDYVEVKAISDIRPYNQHRAFHGDYDSPAALKVRSGLMSVYGWGTESQAKQNVKVYNDYMELISNAKADGLEAVIIALPLHLHAPAAIAAMNAGLHVLTEKLMGHSVWECKDMARSAKANNKHLATGHQRHYNVLYEEAVETIKRGILGDIHYIRAQWHRGNMPGNDSWQKPLPEGAKVIDPNDKKAVEAAKKLTKELASWERKLHGDPKKNGAGRVTGSEIDFWTKKVAQKKAQLADLAIATLAKDEYGYEDKTLTAKGKTYQRPAIEELIRWRLWNRTGGGLMVELGSHQLDAASIFINAMHESKNGKGEKVHPLNVSAMANRPIFGLDREANDHVCCIFEFPHPEYVADDPVLSRKRIGVQYASINGNGFGGYGEMVFGTKGTLILEKEQETKISRHDAASKVKTSAAGATMDTQASGVVAAAKSTGPAEVSRGYAEEIEHWAWCVRENPKPRYEENGDIHGVHPRCYPKVAMADAVIALTSNISAAEGKRIEFKEEWFDPSSPETPEKNILGHDVEPDLTRYKS